MLHSIGIAVLTLLIVGVAPLFAEGAKETAQPKGAAEKWDDVQKAAQKEGKVVVYSVTSRITLAAEKFQAKTGIKVRKQRVG